MTIEDITLPRPPWEVLQDEIKALRESGKDPIPFAIEAIRINLACYAFKDETILLEAMRLLEGIKND